MTPVQESLRLVQRRLEKWALARVALDEAIIGARAEGASLRAIAEASGLSHEQVRRIVKQDVLDVTP
jgi:hypothetical protein